MSRDPLEAEIPCLKEMALHLFLIRNFVSIKQHVLYLQTFVNRTTQLAQNILYSLQTHLTYLGNLPVGAATCKQWVGKLVVPCQVVVPVHADDHLVCPSVTPHSHQQVVVTFPVVRVIALEGFLQFNAHMHEPGVA